MKLFLSLIFFQLAFVLRAAEPVKPAADPISDAVTEKNIARISSLLLEQMHFSQKPFDDEVSAKLLDRYLDSLDGLHLYFLQSDLNQFEVYRTKLDDLTKLGDTRPVHEIFSRLLERVQQRVTYVDKLLKTEKFEFTSDERYTPDRRKLPRPADIEEAHHLWRQQLRSEFLGEKLIQPTTNKVVAADKTKSTDKDLKGAKSKEETNSNVFAKIKPTRLIFVGKEHLTPTEEIIEKLAKRYSNLEKTFKELSDDEVLEVYLDSLARVYDPHSDYMGRSHFENFNISMRLQLVGIGALLESDDGYCKIKELMPGPAMQSKKIKPGDRIVAVAQADEDPVDVVGMKLSKAVDLIRGEKGTEVRLSIWPADAQDSSTRKTVTLIRDVIKLEDQAAKAKVFEVPDQKGTMRLGVIDLPSFYAGAEGDDKNERPGTTADIAKLLKKLNEEKVSGIILDLRMNGGGLLDEAINLTGLFITNGPVVQVKEVSGEIIPLADRDTSISYKGPLIVLTSRFSASASEILAGALQDYGRALIVGDSSTYGKGTVQRLMELAPYLEQKHLVFNYNPGALKPTTAKFYRAGGSSTQLRGVIPDIHLPDVFDYMEVGEASMENPLPWDEVSTARFNKWNIVKPYVADLQKRSDKRIATDKDFSYIHEDIQLFKKALADKSVSLNEKKRQKENKEIKERKETRMTERKSRKPSDEKVFEVTLKNLKEPGLQPYVPKTNEVAAVENDASDLTDDEADEKLPPVDATLDETKRILMDYISLLTKNDPSLSKVP